MTKKPLSFVAIFRTNFVADETASFVLHPVRVAVFKGIKIYKIPKQIAYRFPKNEERTVSVGEVLELPEGHYIEIKVRTKIEGVDEARSFCEAEVDRIISMLTSVFNIHLFDIPIYRGWLLDNDYGVIGGWTQIVDEPKFRVNSKDVEKTLLQMHRYLKNSDDWFNRFTIMSRFLSKALGYIDGEEKFLLLWTALEVFPMKDTSNIEAIGTCLGEILDADVRLVKDKLEIGKLCGIRCSLVHDGKFNVEKTKKVTFDAPEQERRYEYSESDTFARLEYIVREIMRYMCGLPYSGSLDQYL